MVQRWNPAPARRRARLSRRISLGKRQRSGGDSVKPHPLPEIPLGALFRKIPCCYSSIILQNRFFRPSANESIFKSTDMHNRSIRLSVQDGTDYFSRAPRSWRFNRSVSQGMQAAVRTPKILEKPRRLPAHQPLTTTTTQTTTATTTTPTTIIKPGSAA